MNNTGRMKIGIISAGKVGSVLGAALRSKGHEIIGAYASSEASLDRLELLLPGVPALPVTEIAQRAELVLLAVPDDELPGLVSGLAKLDIWKPSRIVVHTAGRFGTEVLEPAARAGAMCLAIHPAMTFTGTSLDLMRLQGCPFAVTAAGIMQTVGRALVGEMGGEPYLIDNADREMYHAALTHGANYLVTLVTQARRMLESIGMEDPGQYLRPLLTAALEGALSSGDALLTGPIVRGDKNTVAGHLSVIKDPDILRVYRALGTATANRARDRKVLPAPIARELRLLLHSGDDESENNPQ